jgi:thiamine pyrophosphate-dependent acetolactate synthase large subunit-like protein
MSLTANIRYEKLANAVEGFNGFFAETPEQIKTALDSALKEKSKPTIINIAISPSADRKAQVCFFFNTKYFFDILLV